MVMLLPQPDMDSLALLDAVIAERQRGQNAAFFNGISAEWRARVQAYIQHSGSPEHVPRWAQIEPRKQTFLNLYASAKPDSAQHAALSRMRDAHELSCCPACGEPGRPNTLDHYLPKGRYPHFCITPLNLFPMCDMCQGEKGTKTGDANSPRFFIHPYFDIFVAEQVIALTLQPPYDAPGFQLGVREGLPQDQTGLVASHMRELALEKRYLHYFRGQHRRLLRLVDGLRRGGQDVRVSLLTFRDAHLLDGANTWDHVFYAAVIEDEQMMAYLEHGQLPALV